MIRKKLVGRKTTFMKKNKPPAQQSVGQSETGTYRLAAYVFSVCQPKKLKCFQGCGVYKVNTPTKYHIFSIFSNHLHHICCYSEGKGQML